MIERPDSRYKWYILALGVVTHMFVVAAPFYCMPVLFEEIADDLGLNLTQIGVVWGMVSLPGMFGAFAAGLLSDHFGATRTLGVACLLNGIAGALRGVSGDFTTLSVFMFLFGLLSIPMTFATHKAAGEWFSGRQLGMANAILAMGMGVGNTVGSMISATVLSPLLGGWRNIMFAYGTITIIISILWLKARRQPGLNKTAQPAATVPFRDALSHVARIRAAWLLALFQTFITCYVTGILGYLPLYLRGIGWPDTSADGALATLAAASVIGVVPLSALSDRIGLRKVILYAAVVMIIIGVGLLSAFSGPVVWVAVIIAGLVHEAFFALSITLIMETRGIGSTYAGTALGLATTLAGLGGFFGPVIGNRLAEMNPRFAFGFWAGMAVIALIVLRFVEETGWKRQGTENTLDGHAI